MSKRLTVGYTRPSGDKIEISTQHENGIEGDKREIFTLRINDDGSLFFEFDRAVSLDLSSSNCFSVRIQK